MKFLPGAQLVALLVASGLAGLCAAKPPDLPHDPPVVVSPQQTPTGRPSIEDWLEPEVLFPPEPAPRPQQHTAFSPRLRQAVTAALLYTVHPLLYLTPAAQVPAAPCVAGPAEAACPHRQCAAKQVRVPSPEQLPSVLDNLRSLQQAADGLARAKKLARAGQHDQAIRQLEAVRKLCPGSCFDQKVDELAEQIILQKAKTSTQNAEEEQSETPGDGCCWLQGYSRFGLCWLQRLSQIVLPPAPMSTPVMGRLQEPITLCYPGTPLAVVLDAIRCRTGLPLVVMGETELGRPVCVHVEQMPTGQVLEQILHPLGLEMVVQGNVVSIRPRPGFVGQKAGSEEASEAPQTESACPKCEKLHAENERASKQRERTAARVNKLMKACYAAIDEGRHDLAAELARKAHRLAPQRVEGDPVVYKLDLLAEKVSIEAKDDTQPESKTPAKPASGQKSNNYPDAGNATPDGLSLQPALPGYPDIVGTLDGILQGKEKQK